MIRGLLLALVLLAAPAHGSNLGPVDVTVTRDGDSFVADFHFPRQAPAWGFFRSSSAATTGKPWRPVSWTVLTPGVRLERRGTQDALVAEGGGAVPSKVRIRVTPFTGDLESDYVPALKLGGRSVALFDGHFAAYSVDSLAALEALAPGFDPKMIGDGGTRLRFAGDGLRIAGDVEGYRTGRSAGAYGLYDVPTPTVQDGVATVVDGELPAWLATDLKALTPRVIEALSDGLGPSGIVEPTILAAWEGAEQKGASMNGGTLKGLILMRFDGQAVLERNPALTEMAMWFIAHEAAHFWLGQSVRYASPRDGWITEGGADLLAIRIMQRLDPAYDPKPKLDAALRDCGTLADQPVATAIERNEHRAYYACGALFALVAERSNGGDFFGFVRALIERNRGDGEVSSDEWLQQLGNGKAEQIRALVDQGADDPQASLQSLLGDAGIPVARGADGTLLLP